MKQSKAPDSNKRRKLPRLIDTLELIQRPSIFEGQIFHERLNLDAFHQLQNSDHLRTNSRDDTWTRGRVGDEIENERLQFQNYTIGLIMAS